MSSRKAKIWIVQGKYTAEYGWEDLAEITEREGGSEAAYNLCREHQMAAPYGQHKVIRRDR